MGRGWEAGRQVGREGGREGGRKRGRAGNGREGRGGGQERGRAGRGEEGEGRQEGREGREGGKGGREGGHGRGAAVGERGAAPRPKLVVVSEVVIEQTRDHPEVGPQAAGESHRLQLRLSVAEPVLEGLRVDAEAVREPRRQLRVWFANTTPNESDLEVFGGVVQEGGRALARHAGVDNGQDEDGAWGRRGTCVNAAAVKTTHLLMYILLAAVKSPDATHRNKQVSRCSLHVWWTTARDQLATRHLWRLRALFPCIGNMILPV